MRMIIMTAMMKITSHGGRLKFRRKTKLFHAVVSRSRVSGILRNDETKRQS